jgi:hypothetical protein
MGVGVVSPFQGVGTSPSVSDPDTPSPLLSEGALVVLATGETVGDGVSFQLSAGEGVLPPFEGVGTFPSVSDPGPPLPLLSEGASVVLATGETVGGGVLFELSAGEGVLPPFEGVGTSPSVSDPGSPLPLLSEGALVVLATGETVGGGILLELSAGEEVLPPLQGVGTSPSVSDPDPPLPLLSEGALVVSATGETVGGGVLLELSAGEEVLPPFQGVGTSPSVSDPGPPLPLLFEGALVVLATGETVGGGVLFELSAAEGVLPPFQGVGTFPSVSVPDPPSPLLSEGALVVLATGETVGDGVSFQLSAGEGVLPPFEGVGTFPSVSDPDPPLPFLSEGALVVLATGETVGGGVLLKLSAGKAVLPPFQGVGTSPSVSDPGPPLPLLFEGALVVLATGETVGGGVLLELSAGEGVLPPFEGVGTSPSVSDPDPPLPLLFEGALVFLATGETVGGGVLFELSTGDGVASPFEGVVPSPCDPPSSTLFEGELVIPTTGARVGGVVFAEISTGEGVDSPLEGLGSLPSPSVSDPDPPLPFDGGLVISTFGAKLGGGVLLEVSAGEGLWSPLKGVGTFPSVSDPPPSTPLEGGLVASF